MIGGQAIGPGALPHDVVDQVLEELIVYVEAVHELSSQRQEGDELLELLLGAQEVVRERRPGCTLEPDNAHVVPASNGGRVLL